MDKFGKSNFEKFYGPDANHAVAGNTKIGHVQTKIKINSEEIPSRIGVTVYPLPAQKRCNHNIISIIGIIMVIILIVQTVNLKQTKRELDELKSIVAKLEASNSKQYIEETHFEEKLRFKRDIIDNSTKDYPLAASFIGGFPEAVINEGGVVAPWFKDTSVKDFNLGDVVLKDGKGSVVIPESGLYFVYAQAYYSTSGKGSSFSIMLVDSDEKETRIATCSNPPGGAGESNCFTGIVYFIKKGTKVQLKQREINRHVLFRRGQTFLGLVLLRPSTD